MACAAVLSTAIVLLLRSLRRTATKAWLNSACVLAIGFGLAVGYYTMSLRVVWPPASGLDRLLTIVVPIALFVELIAGFPRVASWVGWLLRLSLAAATPRILLHGSVYLSDGDGGWSLGQAAATLAVCVALLSGTWWLLARLSQRGPGVSIPLALCLAIQCAGLCVMLAGYIKGGAAAFPLVAALLATAIAIKLAGARITPPANFDTSAIIGVAVISLFGLLFIGRYFGRLSTGSALVMMLAPLLCWATETPLLCCRKPWLIATLRVVLVSIPLFVVLAFAKRDFDRDMAPLLGQVRPASPAYNKSTIRRPIHSTPVQTSIKNMTNHLSQMYSKRGGTSIEARCLRKTRGNSSY